MRLVIGLLLCLIQLSTYSQTYQDSIREIRVKHYAELTDPKNEILSQEEIDHFQGLDYFLIDTNWIINATFKKKKGPKFEMITTTDRRPVYRRTGFIYCKKDSIEFRLTVYKNIALSKQKEYKDYLFIPFRDKTSGKESYGGGRYIDLSNPKQKEVKIDFNLAYNPYCSHSDKFSCPIPPEENTLSLEIRAGEKTPIGH